MRTIREMLAIERAASERRQAQAWRMAERVMHTLADTERADALAPRETDAELAELGAELADATFAEIFESV